MVVGRRSRLICRRMGVPIYRLDSRHECGRQWFNIAFENCRIRRVAEILPSVVDSEKKEIDSHAGWTAGDLGWTPRSQFRGSSSLTCGSG
jgi:hypothetical protein